MAERYFPLTLVKQFNGNAIDWTTADIRAVGLNSTYAFDAADDFLADVIESERATGLLSSGIGGFSVSVVSTDDVRIDTSVDPIALPGKASQTMTQVLYYAHNASEGAAQLLVVKDLVSGVVADNGVNHSPNANGIFTITNPA